MRQNHYLDWQANPDKAAQWKALMPLASSQWRQDHQSNHGGIQRRGIYFVPRTTDDITGEEGKILAFVLRDIWESDFQAEYPAETHVAFFDYATGAANGQYRREWSDDQWTGRAFYFLEDDLLRSFSPALTEFPNQAPPRWQSVARPSASRLGQPAYITLCFWRQQKGITQADDSAQFRIYDSNTQTCFLHITDAPATTDYDKVRALSAPIVTTEGTPPDEQTDEVHPHAWKVEGLPNLAEIFNDRQETLTWEDAKQFIVHAETGAAITDADIT